MTSQQPKNTITVVRSRRLHIIASAVATLAIAAVLSVALSRPAPGGPARPVTASVTASVTAIDRGVVDGAASASSPVSPAPLLDRDTEPRDDLPTLATMASWCAGRDLDDDMCSYTFFADYAASHGIEESIGVVEEMKSAERDFIPLCHSAYHSIGQTAPTVMDASDALLLSTQACQAGYIHGVIQIWATQITAEELSVQAPEFCTPLRTPALDVMFPFCGHGLGHAISLRYPESISKVAQICEGTTGVESPCLEGAIMEFGGSDHVTINIKEELGVDPTASLTQDQRENLCSWVPDLMRDRCWQKIFMLWSDVYDDGPAFVERCARADTPAHVTGCIRSFGELAFYEAAPLSVTDSPEELSAALEPCQALTNAMHTTCYAGLIETLWRDEPLTGAPVDTVCPSLPNAAREGCVEGETAALIARRAA